MTNHLSTIYTKVRNHLLAQKVRSVNDTDQCRYRGPDGTSCAVGGCIKDEFYCEAFEGQSMVDDEIRAAVERSFGFQLSSLDFSLLNSLQVVHDFVPPADWSNALTRVWQSYEVFDR